MMIRVVGGGGCGEGARSREEGRVRGDDRDSGGYE